MNTLTAAVVSLVFGAVVAWYLYYYKNARPVSVKGLALLRLFSTSMLVFALLVRDGSYEEKVPLRPTIEVAVDTSASVAEDVKTYASQLSEELSQLGWQVRTLSFDPKRDYSQEWVYVGDAHIETTKGQAPQAMVLVDSKPLVAPPVIQGVIVPERVGKGNTFELSVSTLSNTDWFLKGPNGTSYYPKNNSVLVKAPATVGKAEFQIHAHHMGREEVKHVWIDVVNYVQKIRVYYARPHEHVGLVVRAARELGYGVEASLLQRKENLERLPIVLIGGGEDVMRTLSQKEDIPLLWMSAPASDAQRERKLSDVKSRFPKWNVRKEFLLSEMVQGRRNKDAFPIPRVQELENIIDARGVDWYASALSDTAIRSVLKAMVQDVVSKSQPMRLLVNVPEPIYQQQIAEVSVYVINPEGRAEREVTYEFEIKQGGTLISRPVGETKPGGVTCTFPKLDAGSYSLNVIAQGIDFKLVKSVQIQVDSTSIERIRPMNENLVAKWEREGTLKLGKEAHNLTDSLRPAIQEITIYKKKPQHQNLWYWGIWLLLASTEWYFRRTRGLR